MSSLLGRESFGSLANDDPFQCRLVLFRFIVPVTVSVPAEAVTMSVNGRFQVGFQ